MKRILTLGVALSLGAVGVACDTDPVQRVSDEPKGPKGPVDDDLPEAVDDEVVEYSYNPIGKRDPFRSFFQNAGPDTIPNPTPLQRFEVDQYMLVGIVWGVAEPKAMVQDPVATGHVIEVGTYIGKNWGKVTAITSDSVIITEEYQTIDGELVTNQLALELPVEELEL